MLFTERLRAGVVFAMARTAQVDCCEVGRFLCYPVRPSVAWINAPTSTAHRAWEAFHESQIGPVSFREFPSIPRSGSDLKSLLHTPIVQKSENQA
jgi:hypothetical protein